MLPSRPLWWGHLISYLVHPENCPTASTVGWYQKFAWFPQFYFSKELSSKSEIGNIFCKGPDRNYYRLCRRWPVETILLCLKKTQNIALGNLNIDNVNKQVWHCSSITLFTKADGGPNLPHSFLTLLCIIQCPSFKRLHRKAFCLDLNARKSYAPPKQMVSLSMTTLNPRTDVSHFSLATRKFRAEFSSKL